MLEHNGFIFDHYFFNYFIFAINICGRFSRRNFWYIFWIVFFYFFLKYSKSFERMESDDELQSPLAEYKNKSP